MTYRPIASPDADVRLAATGDSLGRLLVTLVDDQSGQRFHIGYDDGCYVLYAERDKEAKPTTYWFREAVAAMKSLPENPREAIGAPD